MWNSLPASVNFTSLMILKMCGFYFILWAVVSAGYPALLSSSYFERINDDDDDLSAYLIEQ